MAFEISQKLYSEFSFKKKPIVHILIKFWKLRGKFRYFFRLIYLIFHKKNSSVKEFSIIINSPRLKYGKDSFARNGYVYFEDILENKFHKELINNLPPVSFFKPMNKIEKQYNTGFFWLGGDIKSINYINNFYFLEKIYKYLIEKDFCNQVSELCGDGILRKAVNLNLTYLNSECILFPHKDSIADIKLNKNQEIIKTSLNFMFFITGNDSVINGGQTSLYKDNEYKNVIFKPKTLNNSLLIYSSAHNFYHGFYKTDKEAFRYSINIQYCAAEFGAKY